MKKGIFTCGLFFVVTFVLMAVAVPEVTEAASLQITSDADWVTLEGTEYCRHRIHVIADVESNTAYAWDGEFRGPMHQEMVLDVLSTPMRDNFFLDPLAEATDSHFMFYRGTFFDMNNPATYPYANQMTLQMGIEETTCTSDGYLRGAFGLLPPYFTLPNQPGAAQDLLFAQILVPVGSSVSMVGVFADGNGVKTLVNIPDIGVLCNQSLVFQTVPEPSILGLMMAGSFFLARKRR